jgi:hypothetical protein
MPTTNPHTNYIRQVKLGDIVYDIHDQEAIHSLADLAALGMSTEGIFVFKGTVATVADLPTTGNKVGHVYHVTANHSEYVWALVDGGAAEGWEEFGEHFVVNHTHTVTVTGTNASSSVTGTATVTGGNSTSSVSGSASIANAPKVSASAKYAKVSTGNDTFVKSYPGATSKLVTTSITPAGAATSVISSVTPSTGSVTGVSGSTTASKASAGAAVAVAKAGTAVSIPNVTGNTSVTASKVKSAGSAGSKGSAASWSASVSNGVLSFSFTANTPTTPATIPTFESVTASNTTLGTAISVTPAVSNGNITPYTFTDVTVPKAATAATTVVTGVDTDTANVATVGSATTVATGSLSSSGKGSSVMTGLGTATTASALTSASLAAGTSSDGVHTGDDVTIETQTLSGTISGTAAAQTWTQNTGSISGTAAAQKWTQKTGTTGNPQ